MGQVNYNAALELLIAELNAGGASAWTTSVSDPKTSSGMLGECLVVGDSDVVAAYLDNTNNSFRTPFEQASADLNHGDKLPAHAGVPGRVEIKINSADSVYVPSEPAPSTRKILDWRRNLNGIYGTLAHNAANSPLGGRHRLEDGHLYFTGAFARVWLPQFSIDRVTPKCQADESHTGIVVSRAVVYAHKEGYASDWLFAKHNDKSEKALAGIRSGREVVSTIDQALRAGQ